MSPGAPVTSSRPCWWTATTKMLASPSPRSASSSSRTRPCPPIICTASPDCARLAPAANSRFVIWIDEDQSHGWWWLSINLSPLAQIVQGVMCVQHITNWHHTINPCWSPQHLAHKSPGMNSQLIELNALHHKLNQQDYLASYFPNRLSLHA